MPIKVIIPSGQTEITVNGLHQWDYGQTIEIHDAELPALIEVHFACIGMDEAVVRACSVIDGVATAAVPDVCLEQTTPITAWIYIINGSTGTTQKVIHLPIIPRTRPAASESAPEEYTDKYTELITACEEVIAEAVDSITNTVAHRITNGTIPVGSAANADHATMLTPAESVVTLTDGRALLDLVSGGLYTIAIDYNGTSYTFMLKVGTKDSYSAPSGREGLYLQYLPNNGVLFFLDDSGASIQGTSTAYINRIF